MGGGPGNVLGLCDGDALVCEAGGLVCEAGGLVCEAGGLVCEAGGLVCDVAGLVSADGGFDEECDAAASGGGDVCVGVAEWVAPGEPGLVPADAAGVAGLLEVEDVVHAETETETTTVKVAHAAK